MMSYCEIKNRRYLCYIDQHYKDDELYEFYKKHKRPTVVHAIKDENLPAIKYILTDKVNRKTLIEAVNVGNLEILDYLLRFGKYDIHLSWHAAKCGHIHIIEYFVSLGMKIHKSAIEIAIENDHDDISEYLLRMWLNSNDIDISPNRYNVSRYLIKYNKLEMLKLMDHLHEKNRSIYYAVLYGRTEIFHYLESLGLIAHDASFVISVIFGYLDLAKYFLDNNYDIYYNEDVKLYDTYVDEENLAKHLKETKRNNIPYINKISLVGYAIKNNDLEMLDLLISKGYKCGYEDIVFSLKNNEIIKYLIGSAYNYDGYVNMCNLKSLRLLVSFGFRVNDMTQFAIDDKLSIVKYLQKIGFDIKSLDNDNIINKVVNNKGINVLKYLYENKIHNINVQSLVFRMGSHLLLNNLLEIYPCSSYIINHAMYNNNNDIIKRATKNGAVYDKYSVSSALKGGYKEVVVECAKRDIPFDNNDIEKIILTDDTQLLENIMKYVNVDTSFIMRIAITHNKHNIVNYMNE